MTTRILIQGPIYDNTSSIYRAYKNEGFEVNVSTYSNTKDDLLLNFEKSDLIVSDPPENMGNYNRNGQRITTYYGLKEINSSNVDCFVLKTRSDHFFGDVKKTLKQMVRELKKYQIFLDNQKYRMIIPNAGTTTTEVWGNYHLSDHWMFGHIQDVINYYTIENVDLTKEFQIDSYYSPEPEFCCVWMKNNKIIDTFEELLAKRFIIMDNQKLNYTIAKNCNLNFCQTDWDLWNSTDNGVVSNKKWKKILKKYKL